MVPSRAFVVAGLLLVAGVFAEDVCEGPVVELQLETSDGSFVATEYGVIGAFGSVPPSNGTQPVRLVAAEPLDACAPLAAPLDGAVAIAVRGGCSFVEKYRFILAAGGGAMLMFNDGPGCITMGGSLDNSTGANGTSGGGGAPGGGSGSGSGGGGGGSAPDPSRPAGPSIPAISIDHGLGSKLVNLSKEGRPAVLVSISLLDLPPIDAGAALLWLMAVLTVAGGAYWSGRDHALAVKASAAAGGGAGGGRRGSRGGDDGEGAFDVTAGGAVAFVGVSSAMLLLLYFFMSKAFFYILLAVFTLSAAQALGVAIAAAAAAASPALAARAPALPLLGPVPAPALLAAPLAAAAAGAWAANRDAPWSWPLLDLLGICLLLYVMRTLRLGGLRVACVLLPLCFFYDVFFVFIQPLLFGGGESVMVEVARGAGTDEVMPMLLRVPRLQGPPIARGGYSMLGFGDIILPGLLVALMQRADIDLRLPWTRGYYLPSVVAYAAGLTLTYVALAFSWFGDQGQPALLYLVPCTLGTVLALAAARGDLRRLWADDGSGAALAGSGGGGWSLLSPEAVDGEEARGLGGARGGGGSSTGGGGIGGAWQGSSREHSPTASSTRLLSRGQAGSAV